MGRGVRIRRGRWVRGFIIEAIGHPGVFYYTIDIQYRSIS
jgi:hypothetical protein